MHSIHLIQAYNSLPSVNTICRKRVLQFWKRWCVVTSIFSLSHAVSESTCLCTIPQSFLKLLLTCETAASPRQSSSSSSSSLITPPLPSPSSYFLFIPSSLSLSDGNVEPLILCRMLERTITIPLPTCKFCCLRFVILPVRASSAKTAKLFLRFTVMIYVVPSYSILDSVVP